MHALKLHLMPMAQVSVHGKSYSNYYEKASVVKGHHYYKAIWMPMISEELPVQSEDDNDHGKHTVAVMMDGHTVGQSTSTVKHSTGFTRSNISGQG